MQGSAHYANEVRKERVHKQRIQDMLAMQRSLTAADLARHTASMDSKLAALEATRDLARTWVHVDMDAFFAAVEERNDPRLVGARGGGGDAWGQLGAAATVFFFILRQDG